MSDFFTNLVKLLNKVERVDWIIVLTVVHPHNRRPNKSSIDHMTVSYLNAMRTEDKWHSGAARFRVKGLD